MFVKYQQINSRKYRDEEGGEGGAGDTPTIEQMQETLKDLQTKFDTSETENGRLNAKLTESNKHTKAAETAQAEAERLQNVEKGNFEELYKSSQKAHEDSQAAVLKLQDQIDQKDVNDIAGNLAMEMVPIKGAEKDLKTKIAKRLKSTTEGVKVLDVNGNLTVSTHEALKQELLGSAEFSYMLQGNQASGGSANGGDKGGSSANEQINRADFDALNPTQQSEKMKAGAVVIDN